MNITFNDNRAEWRYVAVALDKNHGMSVSAMAHELTGFEGVEGYHLAYARN